MRRIKYLAMDVDGTLTDGKLYIGPNGEMFKAFNIKDGGGITEMLPIFNITPIIITGRNSEIVKRRCEELNIQICLQGQKNKLAALKSVVDDLSSVAYIGDDHNDLEVMAAVKKAGGLIGCPKNAYFEVIDMADYVSKYDGGEGAVRDFIDYLVDKR